ncbi:MAG: ElyC/SanA/YdcF family protein [Campylobacterota bacterium]|nr:ElyC/SanA/YdcF family protein [Campylobacterota bacterium]
MEFAFILKKVISAFIMPFSIGIILGVVGLIFLYKNKNKYAKIFLTTSLLWIVAISYVPFSNALISPLENKYKKLEQIPTDVKYILLLGGDRENRGWEALRLYHKIKDAKIITSGFEYRGSIPEAIITANILYDLGIPKDDIIIHSKAKDTKEEAIKIKEVLKDEKFILITSAYHMPRAMMIFQKAGLSPIPAPTDFKIKDSDKVISVPSGSNLYKTERAWHEYVGILWTKLKG